MKVVEKGKPNRKEEALKRKQAKEKAKVKKREEKEEQKREAKRKKSIIKKLKENNKETVCNNCKSTLKYSTLDVHIEVNLNKKIKKFYGLDQAGNELADYEYSKIPTGKYHIYCPICSGKERIGYHHEKVCVPEPDDYDDLKRFKMGLYD
jgi:hypothetical protein